MTEIKNLLVNSDTKLHDKLTKYKKNFNKYKNKITKNKQGKVVTDDHWSVGFAYYFIIIIALVDITIFIDFYITNPKILIGTHVTRLILLLSVIIMALASFALGWRETSVSLVFDNFVKLTTFCIAIAYNIIVGIKFGKTKQSDRSNSQYLKLILATSLSAISLFFLIWAVKDSIMYDGDLMDAKTNVGIFFIILTSIVAAILSVVAIKNAAEIKPNVNNTAETIPNNTNPVKV